MPFTMFHRVWRTTTDQPGYSWVRVGRPDTFTLRRMMFAVINRLSAAAVAAGQPPFVPERLGRFDQQVTTKFHRDGAPAASLLVLGYELTTVPSRFYIADVARAAAAEGLGVNAFVAAFNPMFPAGEAKLRPFVSELTWFHDEAAVVVVNNSLFPDGTAAGNPLGVLHKGEIVAPDPAARRVINSVGLMPAGETATAVKTTAEIEHFLTRADLD